MTYLELVQMTVQQSGTVQGIKPDTVIGKVDRLKQFVDFVAEAYIDIQNAHRMWRWLQSYFTEETVAGTRFYSGTAITDEIALSTVDRFSQWGFKEDGSDMSLSIYKTADGNNGEGPLRWLDWDRFYQTQLRGPQTPGKPIFYSVADDNRLALSPIPDDAYTIRGKYRKSPQKLVFDTDVPEMPAEFHTVIKDAALCYIEAFDEGPRIPIYRLRMLPNWSMLEMHQLPKVSWGVPLA